MTQMLTHKELQTNINRLVAVRLGLKRDAKDIKCQREALGRKETELANAFSANSRELKALIEKLGLEERLAGA